MPLDIYMLQVFTTITGSMFSKLLSLRRQLAASYPQLAQQMTQILLHGLFHPDTILEYTSVLKEVNSGGGSKVFVTKMFEDLGNLAGSPKTEEDGMCDRRFHTCNCKLIYVN